jgi:tRNA (guanosine-2'-O-)-methyltransferase
MPGGGPKYERFEREPLLVGELVLDARKERIDQVISQRTRSLTVVLDRLEDNFNMGAVVRTCEAMGLQELHVVRNPNEAWKPNARVSQGSDKWMDVVIHEDFAACREHLKSRGFTLCVSALREGGRSLFDLQFDRKLALVFGNERDGVSDEVVAAADEIFWIPMVGFTRSLNVSAAVSASVTRGIAWRLEHEGRLGDLAPDEKEALTARFLRLSIKQAGKLFK